MAQVVGLPVHFVAILGELLGGDSHDSGIANEDVDLVAGLGENGLRRCVDALERIVVHGDKRHSAGLQHILEDGLGLVQVTGGQEQGRASGRESACGLKALRRSAQVHYSGKAFTHDARGPASNDNDLSSQLALHTLVFNDLKRGRAGISSALRVGMCSSVDTHADDDDEEEEES